MRPAAASGRPAARRTSSSVAGPRNRELARSPRGTAAGPVRRPHTPHHAAGPPLYTSTREPASRSAVPKRPARVSRSRRARCSLRSRARSHAGPRAVVAASALAGTGAGPPAPILTGGGAAFPPPRRVVRRRRPFAVRATPPAPVCRRNQRSPASRERVLLFVGKCRSERPSPPPAFGSCAARGLLRVWSIAGLRTMRSATCRLPSAHAHAYTRRPRRWSPPEHPPRVLEPRCIDAADDSYNPRSGVASRGRFLIWTTPLLAKAGGASLIWCAVA